MTRRNGWLPAILLVLGMAVLPASTRAHDEPASRPTSEALIVPTAGAPSKGNQQAPVTLVEFSDYECPYCGRYARETMPEIEKAYVRAGRVRYVVRDFPLETIHPRAFKAAEGARCAGEQGKFWQMHERIFADQDGLDENDLVRRAESLGLDGGTFRQCLRAGKEAAGVRRDQSEGRRINVQGTPTFFIGYTEPNGTDVRVVKVIVGAQPFDVFKAAIDSLLTSGR